MSDRIRELQRQRALTQEQLAWFDREIAKEAPSAATPTPAVAAGKPETPAVSDHAAEEILAQYSQNPLTAEKDVKRGCYIWFALAMGALALFATGIYLLYSRRP